MFGTLTVETPQTSVSPDQSPCSVIVTDPNAVGYLSNRQLSLGATVPRCGTESHPWVVSVLPGQRINVTLLDFTPQPRSEFEDKKTGTLPKTVCLNFIHLSVCLSVCLSVVCCRVSCCRLTLHRDALHGLCQIRMCGRNYGWSAYYF